MPTSLAPEIRPMHLTAARRSVGSSFRSLVLAVPGRKRSFHARRGEGHVAQACAGSVKNSVSYRRRCYCDGGFSGARGCHILWRHEYCLNNWNFIVEPQADVALPVRRGHPPFVPGDFLHKRTAHALQQAAFHLIPQSIGIRDRPAVDRHDEAARMDDARRGVHVYFSNQSRIAVLAFIGNTGEATPLERHAYSRMRCRPRFPLGRSGCSFQHADQSRLLQVFQAELQWISGSLQAQLVHETFVRERVLDSQRRPQRPGKEWRPYRVGEHALATHQTSALALASDAPRHISRNGIAAVPKLTGGLRRSACLQRFSLVAQQHPGDHVARPVISRPIAKRRNPAFAIPDGDAPSVVKPYPVLDQTRIAVVLPGH